MNDALYPSIRTHTQLFSLAHLLHLLSHKLQHTLHDQPLPSFPHSHWPDSQMIVEADQSVWNEHTVGIPRGR